MEIDNKVSAQVALGYLSTTTAGMAFGLLCITIASLSAMLGPGLALRGGEGANSMHRAVTNMKFESKQCFNFFMLQILFFLLSTFCLMWVLYDRKVALVINAILMIFLIAFIKNGYDIYDTLAVDEKDAVTGVFQNFEQYEGMGDLAQNDDKSNDGNSDISGRQRGSGGNRLLNVQLGQGTQGQPEHYYGESNMRAGTNGSNSQFRFNDGNQNNVYDDQIEIEDNEEEKKEDGIYG